MTKESKTKDELMALLDERIRRLGSKDGARWIRIVRADPAPATEGANWRVSHSGQAGGFAVAIEREMRELQKLYDLSS